MNNIIEYKGYYAKIEYLNPNSDVYTELCAVFDK